MKKMSIVLACSLLAMSAQAAKVPHLDPEMTGAEYRAIFAAMEKSQHSLTSVKAGDPLLAILDLGKRNLDWIAAINATRDDGHKLQLTTPETTSAYPIESPGYSNRKIIKDNLKNLKAEMPAVMADVLFGSGGLPSTTPVDDETFITYARRMNRIYESASRWLLQEPYLSEYENFSFGDVRGYYFLNKETDLEKNLRNWNNLDAETQAKYSDWLLSECHNAYSDYPTCHVELNNKIQSNQVYEYHQRYVGQAQSTYNAYFELQNPRRANVMWDHHYPNIMTMMFQDPDRQDVRDWLKTNVEDEYRLDDWGMKIVYEHGDTLAKVVFEPGATPNVNGLGGDTITMDANRALDEYAVTWIIRHEFGHVLGLPDCYVEFYDAQQKVMVNYQLDITNLMCSRRGHLQPKHFEQLKKNYYRG